MRRKLRYLRYSMRRRCLCCHYYTRTPVNSGAYRCKWCGNQMRILGIYQRSAVTTVWFPMPIKERVSA